MKLFIISGPSQSGKDVLIRRLMKEDKSIGMVVTATTRKPRKGEKDKINHYFLEEKDFKDKERFLETAMVHGNMYGTLKEELKNKLDRFDKVFLRIDVQGTENIMKNHRDELPEEVTTIFVTTEKFSEIKKRIKEKGDENAEVRIGDVKKEIMYLKKNIYEHIINTSLKEEESLMLLKGIIDNNEEMIGEVKEYTDKFDVEEWLKR